MTTVWPNWVGRPTTISAYYQSVWPVWVYSSQPTASVQDLWIEWQTATSTTIDPQVLPPSPEGRERLRKAQARQDLIWRNRSRAGALRRNAARRVAEALLLEHLSPAQREEWKAERAITVHTTDGKRAYRIAYGMAGNVCLIKAEEPPIGKLGYPLRIGTRFCMHVYHPDGMVPNEDNVLAQKLLIEANERHFLELANVS